MADRRRLVAGVALAMVVLPFAAVADELPADGRHLLEAVLSVPPLSLGDHMPAAIEPQSEEAEPGSAASAAAVQPGRLVAAAWCAVVSGGDSEAAPGCDLGVGASLWSFAVRDRGWLSFVVLIGAETVAAGLSWTVFVMAHPVSVGIGVLVPHGGGVGIDLDQLAPAVGATFGIGGGAR